MEINRSNEKDKSVLFPKLSRSLYISNLDENINDATLHKYFGKFGDIISIHIKKEDNVTDRSLKVYAFIKYFDTTSVLLAMLKMNGVDIEGCHVRLSFGKSYPSNCVWITGIKESEDNNFLLTYLADCGPIITCSFDEINKRALVYFKEIADAETAINKMNGDFRNGSYFRGDFASVDCQVKFSEFFNKQNCKKCLPISMDNVDIQNLSVSNVNKEKSAEIHYVEADNSCIASKESTLQITCIWINGIADSVTNECLVSQFSQFGPIRKCLIDQFNKCALLCFQEEIHAQTAVTVMNGSYIEGESVYVCLASLRCQACQVPNINNDNFTNQQHNDSAQSSPNSAHHVDPFCKCIINDDTCPINISDPRYNLININNDQYIISYDKYLSIYNNITNDSSKANHVNKISITIIFNEYPPERLKPQTQDFDVLSLPLPEFAKNISQELTRKFSNSLSSNAGINQATYTFGVHHDEMINYGLDKTDNQVENQDQNNNHPLKSNDKMLESVKYIESAAAQQSNFFKEAKRFQVVSNKIVPKEFIQFRSSPGFQDQHLSSSLSTLLSSSSKYSQSHCASNIQSQYYSPSDTQKMLLSKQINKQKPLDQFVAINSIESVVQPIFVDVENSTNIDKEQTDDNTYKKSIGNILLSFKKNYQNEILSNETKDKIIKTNYNESASSISNNGNNKSVHYNHVEINEYKDNESQNISSTRSVGCISRNIKSNDEVEKTNVNEYNIQRLNNKKIKKTNTYENKYCKSKIILDSKSIEPIDNKHKPLEFDMFKTKQTIKKKKEFLIKSETNEDYKFGKRHISIEEKQNLNIFKNYKNSRKDYKYKNVKDLHQNDSCFNFDINNDDKSKKYINKIDGNITSSYCSTENSLKRSISNSSENHNDPKRFKTYNKTYKNNCTKTSKHRSSMSKRSKNINNNQKLENKNMSKLDKTLNQPGIRGWLNGHSIFDILSNKPKALVSNKVKD